MAKKALNKTLCSLESNLRSQWKSLLEGLRTRAEVDKKETGRTEWGGRERGAMGKGGWNPGSTDGNG